MNRTIMKVAILSTPVCPYTVDIIKHFKANDFVIDAVIIEQDIRKKYSKNELIFRNAHDKFNRKFKKYSLSRRITRRVWDNLVPKFIKNYIQKNIETIPIIKKVATKNFAEQNGVPVFSTKKHSGEDVKKFLIENKIDYLLLASSNWLLKEPLLGTDLYKIISIHPGLLPKYKGLDSLQWTIKEGGKIGNTAFFVNKDLDAGAILKFYEEPILEGDSTAIIQRRMTSKKPKIYLDILKGLENKSIIPKKQSGSEKPLQPMSFEQLLEVEHILQERIEKQKL